MDTSYDYYLDNWYHKMDLMCASDVTSRFLVSFYTLSFGVAGFFYFPLPEIYGRRRILLIALTISLIAQYILLFTQGYWGKVIGFIIMGQG